MAGLALTLNIDASATGKNIGRNLPMDADSLTYITNTGMSNQLHKAALNVFVTGLKDAGLWSKHQFLCLFYGTTAASQAVKLKGTGPVTFLNDSAGAHTSAGYVFLKSALRSADTNETLASATNYFAGVHNSTPDVDNSVLLTTTGVTIFLARAGTGTTGRIGGQAYATGYDKTKTGLLLASNANLSNLALYDDAVLIASNNTTVASQSSFNSMPTVKLGKFDSGSFESNATITYAGAGTAALTGTEVATLNTLLKALNTAWGR